jgi:D-beta-D-heptose 7-phosphate kinase/D-beta-D-heptose 1-phosphate adenosyltransferase|tara:strand:- start:413 stop:1147 length:735 start_codon:yes stop_codon:yes gene_type:complete
MSKVLVIGDSCNDVFIYGDIHRVCPEAPVPVFNPTHQTENDGMAKNVVRNLEALGCNVEFISNDNSIKKIRYVDNRSNQMVLRVDENDKCRSINENEIDYIKKYGKRFDAVIISDYCKGFLDEEDICFIADKCNNVFLDTKKEIGDWANDVDFIKINELEYEKNYKGKPNNDKLIVTLGSKGCQYMGETFSVNEVSVKDVSGAGDTFMAGLVVKYIKTLDIKESIHFAQECTTTVVQKIGVVTI